MKKVAIRGSAVTFTDNPFIVGNAALYHEPDALILIENGMIKLFGPYNKFASAIPEDAQLTHYGDRYVILPGFIDLHVHYPQTQIIAAFGERLIEWLEKYTFIAEQSFSDKEHARTVAQVFLQECLRCGTTSAAVYCTVHETSVDVLFQEADRLNMRMIAGKVLMDRNAPLSLRDTARTGYDSSKALIKRWHQHRRQLYCVSPRFAPSCSPEQMELAAALWHESPGTYLQSHVSETRDEVRWALQLFPERKSYLDIYDHYGQLGPRCILGHGVWLTRDERRRCAETGTAIAHCPSSNSFLGSGRLRLREFVQRGTPIRIGLGTDVGAGTSLSQLSTMREAYKTAQADRYPLTAAKAYYLATRGAAEALYLDYVIGSIREGFEGDLVVLDLHSTPLIHFRMKECRDIHEALFVQMMMGDDRATHATYVAGDLAYKKRSEERAP